MYAVFSVRAASAMIGVVEGLVLEVVVLRGAALHVAGRSALATRAFRPEPISVAHAHPVRARGTLQNTSDIK